MMKADQERVKNLLIDTVTLLCKNSLTYEDELCVEGLLGVKVDQKDVFFVHISETFPSALSVQKAQEAARLQEEAAAARLQGEDGEGSGTPSNSHNNKRGHSDSPAHRDSPQSHKRESNMNIKTETVDSGDDCCITEDPSQPPVLLRTPGSVGAHPAHKVAGQRRPVHSPRSPHTPQQHTDSSYHDQPQFPSKSGYGDYPEFSNVGKHEAGEQGEDEPLRKRPAMSGDEEGAEDDSYSGSQWPNLAGVHGIGDFSGQVAQQSFQDSGDSQLSGGGGDLTGQPGCSTWPTGLQQPAGDTTPRHWSASMANPGDWYRGEKPHLCVQCGRRYANLPMLKRHMYTHTGAMPIHDCTVCGKIFKTPALLLRHQRCHTGERPYSCPVCGYRCKQKGYIKIHLSRHTKFTLEKFKSEIEAAGISLVSILKAKLAPPVMSQSSPTMVNAPDIAGVSSLARPSSPPSSYQPPFAMGQQPCFRGPQQLSSGPVFPTLEPPLFTDEKFKLFEERVKEAASKAVTSLLASRRQDSPSPEPEPRFPTQQQHHSLHSPPPKSEHLFSVSPDSSCPVFPISQPIFPSLEKLPEDTINEPPHSRSPAETRPCSLTLEPSSPPTFESIFPGLGPDSP